MERLTKPEQRECGQCKKQFIAKRNTYGLFCSRSCVAKAHYDITLKPHRGDWTGKTHTEEWKQMMSEKFTGRVFTPETIAKMSDRAKNRTTPHPMLGKHHSEETKQKIGEKAKIRPSKLKGKKGKKHSIEVRIKMSNAQKERYKDTRMPLSERQELTKIRGSLEMKLWKETVFKRDDYTCDYCGKRGGDLHAHHLRSFSNFPEVRFDVDNGMTICVKCHRYIHAKKVAIFYDTMIGEVVKRNTTITAAHA